MKPQIVTVTLNPMVEKRLWIDNFTLGGIHRCHYSECNAGGKGVNVARQLLQLGNRPFALLCAGGSTGQFLDELLTRERLPHRILDTGSMLREGWTIYDKNQKEIASFFEPSASLPLTILQELQTGIATQSHEAKWLACCGSAPDTDPAFIYHALISQAKQAGLLTALDTYGITLEHAITACPTLLKINAQEAAALCGHDVTDISSFSDFLQKIAPFQIPYCIITQGAKPFFGAHGGVIWRVSPPFVETKNPTGSGDSLLAGVLSALLENADFPVALRLGAAAGAANASQHSVSNAPKKDIEVFVSQVICEECC